jgi:hypothetical protein
VGLPWLVPCRLPRFSRRDRRGFFGGLAYLLHGDASLDAANGGVVATHDGAHGLTEVAQQVPAIGDVDGPGCTTSGAVSIDVGSVAGDHLHAGVTAQPFGEGAGVPIGQEIDDGAALEVDQDRSVAAALAPRPVVDPEHARHWWLGAGRRPGEPQERVGAGRHGEACREPRPSLAAQSEGELALDVGEALATLGGTMGDAGQPLGEGPSRAGRLSTEEPSSPDPDGHRTALPGQVGQAPFVPAVDPT